MLNHFNTASLAKLPKSGLQTLLASYQGKLHATSDEQERASLQSQIATIRCALDLK